MNFEIKTGINLFHCDCMDLMRETPDKYYDLCICDPPYGIGNWIQQTGNKRGDAVEWNNSIPPINYFNELKRVSKDQIIWGANYYNCFNDSGGAIVWDKCQPNPKFSKCEIASYSRLKRVDYIKIAWDPFSRNEIIIHECQKPIKLYKWILKNYAKPDFKIIDTHLGSGSSAIAAYDFGIAEFVGCEIDKDYYESALKRFETYKLQAKLQFT